MHGSAEPTLAQIPDAKGSKELMAMFRTLTSQPITVPVASLRIAEAEYDLCQTLQAGKHSCGACRRHYVQKLRRRPARGVTNTKRDLGI